MGVQDFDAEVQYLVNRVQPYEVTEELTRDAREIGYTSVNYDLIYGLPKQSSARIRKTAELTLGLRPDRIAFLFAGSQKSVAVGAPLAAILFPPASAGFVIAPLLLYHLAQLVIAAPLATRLARRPH